MSLALSTTCKGQDLPPNFADSGAEGLLAAFWGPWVLLGSSVTASGDLEEILSFPVPSHPFFP